MMKKKCRENLEKILKGESSISYDIPKPDFAKAVSGLTIPQQAMFNRLAPVNLFISGQNSGKTFFGGVFSAQYIYNNPQAPGLICANTYTQVDQTTMSKIKKVWRALFGWREYNWETGEGDYISGKIPPKEFKTEGHDFKTYTNKVSFRNGCFIIVGSLENAKAIDGIDVGWAILDEVKDTREVDVKEVILGRLRAKGIVKNGKTFNPILFITSPAKEDWINEFFNLYEYEHEIMSTIFSEVTFFQKMHSNKSIVISSTHHNKKNIPEDFIANQLLNLSDKRAAMLIWGSPFAKSGGEFWKSFERGKSLVIAPYNNQLPLHISFDFNVAPYITAIVNQSYDSGLTFKTIKVITLESPNNNTPSLCEHIVDLYKDHEAGVFIYGDPAGKQRDTRAKGERNDYTIIKRELSVFNPRERVDRVAPSVVQSANFINQVFKNNLYGISLLFDKDNCAKLIADFEFLQENSDGTINKKKVKDSEGRLVEKYGHTSDAWRYMVIRFFRKEYKRYLKQGVTNRQGKVSDRFKSFGYNKNDSRG